jgi:hypothetical protein
MTYATPGPGALDYLPCRYGSSRLMFRGPRRKLDEPFVACLGGTETYGKFIPSPYPDLLERSIGRTCANFGQVNAGIDAFSNDPFVMETVQSADITVIQILGAQNITNRFYTVHPRRNDRLIRASDMLRTIYRDVDFADFHFTKHLLSHLRLVSPSRFEVVRSELQQAWVARMRALLSRTGGKSVLLWFAPMEAPEAADEGEGLGLDPLFVTRDMLEKVALSADALVECVPSPEARATGTAGKCFTPLEEPAAAEVLGPLAHEEAAQALRRTIERIG